jgi:phage terminase large subunit-like protein
MEANLLHGEGDVEGEPFRLAPHQLRVLYRWFEYDRRTREYLHRKGLIGWGKGNAKSELESALAVEHLEGPSLVQGTPVVTVAAVDGDQAAELVRIAGLMVKDQPVGERLEVFAGRILQREDFGGAGYVKSVSTNLGKNDGKRTSLLLDDELHEWDGAGQPAFAGAKRHGVLERNTYKRKGGRQLNITTAGFSLESLAGAMYTYGAKVASGEVVDPAFLMDWWEASPHWDLDDPRQLLEAIAEANPAADLFWPASNLVRSYAEHKLRGEIRDFIRYHLNRWVGVLEDAWMDVELWRARSVATSAPDGSVVVGPPPPDGTAVVVGFDGSYYGDSTALVGATVAAEPYLWVIGCWERPSPAPAEWKVPVTEVEDAIIAACRRWEVAEVAADVSYWQSSMARLADRGLPIVEFPQSPMRMATACQRLYEGVTRAMATHSGDPRLNRHVANARRHETEWGVRIVKEHAHSERRIDLAVAAVQAHERASVLAYAKAAKEPTVHTWDDDDEEFDAILQEELDEEDGGGVDGA